MSVSPELDFMQHTFDQGVSAKICHLVYSTISTHGRHNLVTESMRPKNY